MSKTKLRFGNWSLDITHRTFRRGFTIIELLIYVGVLTVILAVLTVVLSLVIDTQLESDATSHVQMDGRFILARMAYDINRATTIVSPGLGSQSATLQLTIDGASYTYGVSGNSLTLTDATGTSNLNGYGTTVSALSFRQIGNVGNRNTVRVTYTLTSLAEDTSGPEVKTFTTTVGLR